jgi:OOP family OmpA-OmpF porin
MEINTMKKYSILLSALIISSASAAGGLGGYGTVDVQRLRPTANDVYQLVDGAAIRFSPYESNETNHKTRFGLVAQYGFLDNAYVYYSSAFTSGHKVLIDGINSLDLGLALRIGGNVEIFATAPIFYIHAPDYFAKRKFAFGDTEARIKFKLLESEDRTSNFAIIGLGRFTTGREDLSLGAPHIGYGAKLAYEKLFGKVSIAANAGYFKSKDEVAGFSDELDYRKIVPYGIGMNWQFADTAGMNLELNEEAAFGDKNSPGDLYLGLHKEYCKGCFNMYAGVGLRSLNFTDNGHFRVIAGLKFSPVPAGDEPAPAPVAVVAAPEVKPEPIAPVVEAPKKVVLNDKTIDINGKVNFKNNSAVLLPESKVLLDEVAGVIIENKDVIKKVTVEGHTNRLGKNHMPLSKSRAKSVKDYLVGKGVPATIITSVGYGSSRPYSPKKATVKEQLDADRRVEFKVDRK